MSNQETRAANSYEPRGCNNGDLYAIRPRDETKRRPISLVRLLKGSPRLSSPMTESTIIKGKFGTKPRDISKKCLRPQFVFEPHFPSNRPLLLSCPIFALSLAGQRVLFLLALAIDIKSQGSSSPAQADEVRRVGSAPMQVKLRPLIIMAVMLPTPLRVDRINNVKHRHNCFCFLLFS